MFSFIKNIFKGTLRKACKKGDIEAVKQHLAAGVDVNAKIGGETPLHFAALFGRKEVAELLIAKGADVNAKDAVVGFTPLHRAAYHGRKEVAELLIAKGADVNAKDKYGGTPLSNAAQLIYHKETIELLIAKGADVNAKDDDGDTPLDQAFGSLEYLGGDCTEQFYLLRKHGAKMAEELKAAEPVAEAAKPEPPTAKVPDISIHKAAEDGNIEAVKQHLDAGANVNAMRVGGTPLHLAASWGHKEVAELLIDNGADVNAREDWYEETPLHDAAMRDHKEITELLIDAGADVNAENEYGDTPLDVAIQLKHTQTADLLRKHGGKTGEELESAPQRKTSTALKAASSKKSKSPIPKWAIAAVGGVTMMALVMYFLSGPSVDIHTAAWHGNIEAVKQHLAAGSDVNAKAEGGWAPLHLSVQNGKKEVSELLISEGADVNAKNKNGQTPLHLAAYGGHKEIAELLIASGADVNAKNDVGWTPLYYAAYHGHKEIAELLIAKNANVNAKNNGGETPLDGAIINNDPETADLLRKHGGKTGEELKAEGK